MLLFWSVPRRAIGDFTMTFHVFVCNKCSAAVFPARYLCPNCGNAEWSEKTAERGTIAESTTVHRRIGAQPSELVHLASVATDAGPIVVAHLEHALPVGAQVRLTIDDTNRICAYQ